MAISDNLLLPEGARLVHIGPHKTGSTAIQNALHESRADLARHNVHYAGVSARPRRAGWALGIGNPRGGIPRPPIGRWLDLVREVEEAGAQRVCVSNEDFGRSATPEQVTKVVQGLGGDAVHVVAVARRLDRYLPSQWQERVKSGQTKSYGEWLEVVLAEESDAWDWRNVWRAHDVEALVKRWSAEVGTENFTLIVTDDTNRDLLPRTFEQLLGLPEGLLVVRPEGSNRGLSWSEVEVVRALNQASKARGWPRAMHDDFVKRGVVRTLRSLPRSELGARTPPLPAWAVDRVRALADARVESVNNLGVRVVGDPEVLRLPEDASTGSGDDYPPVSVEIAARAIEVVIVEAGKRSRPRKRARGTRAKAAAEPIQAEVVRTRRLEALARRVRRRLRSARS